MKRSVNGIVHDQSATGKTVFIEPAEVVEAGNRLRELEMDERREIAIVLTAITDTIRPYVEEIVEQLGKVIEAEMNIRLKKVQSRQNKYTAKYHK